MANLVILESPYKAPTIKSYLGSNYKVVASVGHVRDLPKSSLGVDIENDFEPKYINIRGKGDIINALKKDAKKADKIFFATDPDREGEAISWHLATILGIKPEDAKRVTFNEVTKTAVKAGIKNPRPIDMNLVNSQQTRRILDRVVGYKLSPFLWKTVKSGLSAGRVQSVATRIIVERENEIKSFIPQEYWSLVYTLETENGEHIRVRFFADPKGNKELGNKEQTDAVVNATADGVFSVRSITESIKKRSPLPPYTTSTLQQDAYKKLGFQSARIMRIAQELYEGINVGEENGGTHGLITYMRTDSMRVSDEAAAAAEQFIKDKYGKEYYPSKRRIFKAKKNSQDAHEAIRPTSVDLEPDRVKKYLSTDQYKLYKLIWERFVASQMAVAVIDTVSVDIDNNGYTFRANGSTVKFKGYQCVYDDTFDSDDEDAQKGALPVLKEGEKLTRLDTAPTQHFTEPPARYTDGTLVKFLEEKGIGRPSTFTSIITTIISRGYVARDGKFLKPTPLGEITTEIMMDKFPDIVDYKFTAQMEDALDDIENSKDNGVHVLKDFYGKFARDLENAFATVSKEDITIPVEETDIICEKCGSKMIIKNGRFGKFAACPNYPECKNTKALDKNGNVVVKEEKTTEPTGEKCEICGGDMVMRAGRYGKFIACSNYPTCKNTKQILNEAGVNCPDCGGKVLVRQGKRRSVFYSCENYPKCKFSSWDLPLNEKCPQCGKILFKKKTKGTVVCADKACGYKREESEEAND